MLRSSTTLALLGLFLGVALPVHSGNLEYTDTSASRQIKWPTAGVKVALSHSLLTPGPNIKFGSDVVGAARRALLHWSNVANVRFVVTQTKIQSISSTSGGDGSSLITVADTPENNSIFAGGNSTGRTRIFYDSTSGAIAEADVVMNPYPTGPSGESVQFSTDGTPGTYDLESTFTHELGHLLGLEHSNVLASTMNSHQVLNGTYDVPANTLRTLSDDDRAAIRKIYGPQAGLGAIEGRILDSMDGSLIPIAGAHIWAEEVASGRVLASTVSLSDGSYSLESLPAATYRLVAQYLDFDSEDLDALAVSSELLPFRTSEVASRISVKAETPTPFDIVLVAPQNFAPSIKPKLIGINGALSNTAIPLEAGMTYTVYVSGPGLDQIPATGITVLSPFIKVDPASVGLQQFAMPFPMISFEVIVARRAPFGDYSIRLLANSGELACLAGAITIDPAN